MNQTPASTFEMRIADLERSLAAERERSTTSRQEALEEAARIADREDDECYEGAARAMNAIEAAKWRYAANTARIIAKDIRSLAASVPGGAGTKVLDASERAAFGRAVVRAGTVVGSLPVAPDAAQAGPSPSVTITIPADP